MTEVLRVKIMTVGYNQDSEIGKVRKVYRTKVGYTGSGRHIYYLVWSDVFGKCVWVKDNTVLVVA
jgi:hypothetical protein